MGENPGNNPYTVPDELIYYGHERCITLFIRAMLSALMWALTINST